MPAETVRTEVLVLGAGASGLLCASEAARRGRGVLVLDHMPRPGSRIRITGGGWCNFTNRTVTFGQYLSENPRFAISALSRFTPRDIIAVLDAGGIPWQERDQGRIFCQHSADRVVELLVGLAREAGVSLRFGLEIGAVARRAEGGFRVDCGGDQAIEAESLVVATGGLSWPSIGASSLGLDIARTMGLTVIEPRPALVPLTWNAADKDRFGPLTGVSCPVAIQAPGSPTFRDALLFTHGGLSGPATLQVSSWWRAGQPITVDLLPGTDLLSDLREARRVRPRTHLKTVLAARLPRRLVEALWTEEDRFLAETSERTLERACRMLQSWTIHPAGTAGWTVAEVTAGGVSTSELSSRTMEVRKIPGLYFVGEVVDMTGWLGGYNLHWAWSSGWCAGQVV